jgi:hypothetical protein
MSLVVINDNHLNPDCEAGKHGACHGDAWSIEDDRPVDCECACHIDLQDVAA